MSQVISSQTIDYIFNKFGLDPSAGPKFEFAEGRGELAILWHELDFKSGAEIGVESGRYSQHICSMNPGVKLYCVDPWRAYPGYREHVTQEHLDLLYKDALGRTKGFDCEIIRQFSMEAVKEFDDSSLDFVYIDANHDFKNVTDDVTEWSKKVRPGGIVSGHDYRRSKVGSRNDTVDAIDAYIKANSIDPWFVWAGDSAPSWMWVKT